jgi:antitoxin component of MazEF toxin-antitoxin module
MADKKYSERNIRKITKNGTSHSVSIPVEILKTLGWKERQKVVVKLQRKKIVISDWKAKKK